MIDWNEISKMVGMLGSEHDGEVLAAVRAIRKRVPINDLVQRVATGAEPSTAHVNIIVSKRTHRQWAEGERHRMRQERDAARKVR